MRQLSFTNWSEAQRVRVVGLGCVAYLLAACVVVVDTFTSVLTVGGIVGLLNNPAFVFATTQACVPDRRRATDDTPASLRHG